MEETHFERIKEEVILMAKRQNACTEGFKLLVKSSNLGEFRFILNRYWNEIVKMSKKDNFQFFIKNYGLFHDSLNTCGVWFNENTDIGNVIVTEGRHSISGKAKVWAFGNSYIELSGSAKCVALEDTTVFANEHTSVQLFDNSSCYAYGRSNVNANGNSQIFAYESCNIYAGEHSKVNAHGWEHITAVGNAEIIAPFTYKIKVLNNAKLTTKKTGI